jgi:hypothetical protein
MLPSFSLWSDALRFHARYVLTLLPAAPLLCVPLYTDVFHSYLLKEMSEGGIRVGAAASAAARAVPATLWLKLSNELRGLAWSLIPIIFIVRVIEHRLCWGLASNVVAFEGLRGDEADARCRTLARAGYDLGLRGLIGIPFLLAVGVLVAANFAGEVTHSRGVFWVAALAWLWIFLPGSAAVNTFYYLTLVDQERSAAATASAAVAPGPAPPLF